MVIKTYPGQRIEEACLLAVEKAKLIQCSCSFEFNGVEVVAGRSSTREGLVAFYHDELSRQAEEYRKSPKGISDAEASKKRLEDAQEVVNECITNLPALLVAGTMDDLMRLLEKFTPASDWIGIEYDKADLVKALNSAGYVDNMHVGLPPERFSDRRLMGEYITGQVINCLNNGMGPAPVTVSFIEKYFKLN